MDWRSIALVAAGVLGVGVSLAHGVIMQRLMVAPIARHRPPMAPAAARLVAPLLHYSTFGWFTCGLALIAAGLWLGPQARWAIGLLAATHYVFVSAANAWGTRGRHPGWMLLAVAIVLIGFALS